MKFDPSLIPSTLDAVHLGLAAALFLLMLLMLIFLTFAMIAMLRRPKQIEVVAAAETNDKIQASSEDNENVIAKPEPTPAPAPAPAPAPILREATPDAALQLLAMLQKEARFLDFIDEDVSVFSDEEIGAAARVVHEGCRKSINAHFNYEPVRREEESSRITVPEGFDSSEIRLTGHIVGKAPFSGTLVHRGWQVTKVNLPKLAEGHNTHIIASAEVEL